MPYKYFIFIFFGMTGSILSLESSGNPANESLQIYDRFYPYYIKYCTMSRIHPKYGHGRIGGSPGHAVMYIKGACLANQKNPSELEVCDLGKNYQDPELGVGISTNKNLRNVNFVATPGQKLFFGLRQFEGERFTLELRESLVHQFIQTKALKKVDFHPHEHFKKSDHKDEFFAQRMFGTDYGIAFARNLYCINIPTDRSVTKYIVSELNKINRSYKGTSGASYRGGHKRDSFFHWHGIFNNCTHTLVNLLAKLGVMGEKKINQSLIEQLSDIAIPANVFLALQKKLITRIIDPKLYFSKKGRKETLKNFSWMAQQPGIVLQKIPFYQANDLYNENDEMLTIPDAFGLESRKLRELMNKEELVLSTDHLFDYGKNMQFYIKKYQEALKKTEEEKMALEKKLVLNEKEGDYYHFLEQFMGHLKKKVAKFLLYGI